MICILPFHQWLPVHLRNIWGMSIAASLTDGNFKQWEKTLWIKFICICIYAVTYISKHIYMCWHVPCDIGIGVVLMISGCLYNDPDSFVIWSISGYVLSRRIVWNRLVLVHVCTKEITDIWDWISNSIHSRPNIHSLPWSQCGFRYSLMNKLLVHVSICNDIIQYKKTRLIWFVD